MASISFRDNYGGFQLGKNEGHVEFHLPPERPETPPSPSSTVPFPRDPGFVTRDTLLHQIHEKASVPGGGSRIALVGLGGVGKSQLAIEYSYQVRSKSPATWVFWVYASNEARFEQSFRDIADQVKIYGRQDPKANIFKLVENMLWDESLGKWVCIIDNVDDDRFLCSLPTAGKGDSTIGPTNGLTKKPLLEYVPRSRNGCIIITSRSREIALKMVDHEDLIKVEPMEKSESLELLRRKLNHPEESQVSLQLVKTLEFMPLAIIQAASYIRNRAPRYSVSQYLADFEGSDRKATRLLEKEAGCLPRDWGAKNSILVTWQISFDYLRQTNPSATELFSLMSFFDRQGIPEKLIRHQYKANYISTPEPLGSSSDEELSEPDIDAEFEDDIMTLRDFSFISVSENSTLFTMHRLVQLTMRAWLNSREQIEPWRERFIGILCEALPAGPNESWERHRILFPHIKSAISQRPASPNSRLQWATVLFSGAWYAWICGNVSDTREMASLSRGEMLRCLDGDCKKVVDSTWMLALSYVLEGRWNDAEGLGLQAIELCKIKLGEGHPTMLTSISNLASIYARQGRWREAETLSKQMLESRKTKLGDNHPDTLTSMANLASTYSDQGRCEEAEKLSNQVLESRKVLLGDDHPDTLSSMGSLASIYSNQGRWEKAEKLSNQVLESRKVLLGDDHPDTLSSMGSLASIYRQSGKWKMAEKLSKQAIETSKTTLGQNARETLSNMANLAMTQMEQGLWEQSENLSTQVMETCRTNFGEDHPDTLTCIAHLASIYHSQGRLEEAERLSNQVLESCKAKLGENHPDTLSNMTKLALIYWHQGRWEEAKKLNVQVLKARAANFGEDHPSTLQSMANLAATQMKQCLWEQSEKLSMCVIEACQTKLSEDHPISLSCKANLASAYSHQGRWEEAEKFGVQVMETRKTKLGEDHPDTLTSMVDLAFTLKSSGQNAQAIELLRNCFPKQREKLGLDHPHTLSTSRTLLAWETENLKIKS